MKDLYFPNKDNIYMPFYKLDNYIISEEPERNKKMSIAQRINKFILKPNHLKNNIIEEPQIIDWIPPNAIYKR